MSSGAGPSRLDGFGSVEQWLAMQPLGGAVRFADGRPLCRKSGPILGS
jgi:hypothetical protein